MQSLAEIVDELFACLGPLKMCEEPIQDRCVDPLQDYVIDPLQEQCIDPVSRAMAIPSSTMPTSAAARCYSFQKAATV